MVTDDNIQEELRRLQALLALEKEADLEYHRRKIASLPLDERVREGYAWYPVTVAKTGYTIGNRAFVTVERPEPHTPDHFRAGNVVSLFTRQAHVKNPDRSGVIQFVDRGRMKIVLNQMDLPEWLGMGQLGVDLLFDDRTYMEMEAALNKVIHARNDRLAELRDILLGKFQSRFRPLNELLKSARLNDSQNEALRDALSALDLTVIHGPPGTGKTTTLVEIVRELAQVEASILVTAPSNTAVDLLTERLAAAGLRVLRIGNISRIDEDLLQHTLDVQIARHPDTKTIKKLKIEAAELRRKAGRYQRKYGHEERSQRGQLYKEAGEVSAWANQLEERLIEQLLHGAQVITATLVGANNSILDKMRFRTVVIDEAAQALEPATWIPIIKANRVILAGDPFQLPPTIKSDAARRDGLEQTLIEKALLRQPLTRLLRTQYRMNERIMAFSNAAFYNGALEAHPSVAYHAIPHSTEAEVVFIDTAGSGCDEQVQPLSQSRSNRDEYYILREHLYELIEHYTFYELLPEPDIAIISPYREQVRLMKQAIEEDSRLQNLPITVNTIDGFQGQERDVVYISLVRSNNRSEIGFLKDYRRMNVAMTRARRKLVVVGDSATIGTDPFYAQFIEYCENNGAYRTAWEFMKTE